MTTCPCTVIHALLCVLATSQLSSRKSPVNLPPCAQDAYLVFQVRHAVYGYSILHPGYFKWSHVHSCVLVCMSFNLSMIPCRQKTVLKCPIKTEHPTIGQKAFTAKTLSLLRVDAYKGNPQTKCLQPIYLLFKV